MKNRYLYTIGENRRKEPIEVFADDDDARYETERTSAWENENGCLVGWSRESFLDSSELQVSVHKYGSAAHGGLTVLVSCAGKDEALVVAPGEMEVKQILRDLRDAANYLLENA